MVAKYKVELAELSDVEAWMNLLELVRDNFPGLETAEQLENYRQTLLKNIQRRTAICIRYGQQVVGALLFSKRQKCLSWMAVHPCHRRRGLGKKLVEKMFSFFPKDTEIWVSTFRAGDEKAAAPRALYKKLGFVEGDLGEEFGYPSQRLVRRKG